MSEGSMVYRSSEGMRNPVVSLQVLLVLLVVLSLLPYPTGAIRYTMDTPLSKADASFLGESASDEAGKALAIVGDVNGDGYDDILVGAAGNDQGGSGAGKAYLVLGRPAGWPKGMNLSGSDASFVGEAALDLAGSSVAGGGDVNGDGYDDLLIGAKANGEGGTLAGQVYLVLGKPSGWTKDMGLAGADASFISEAPGDGAGADTAIIGDANGDGFDDILIGADSNDEGGADAGKVYLVFGKASGWARDINLTNADASFVGENAGDLAGFSVGGAGDVNGDGHRDIIIGAYKNDAVGSDAGRAYLILGKASGWAKGTDLSAADAIFTGEADADYAGWSVAGAGDVDGDGYGDMLIGAYGNDANGNAAGQTYLVKGKASGWGGNTGLAGADASFLGEAGMDGTGYSVAGAGDVNGDGFDDILLGTPTRSSGALMGGETYLILGKASGWAMDSLLPAVDASFAGDSILEASGWPAVGGGDLNGDGYDDVLIGASSNSDAGGQAGKVDVFFLDLNDGPTAVASVKAYQDGTYAQEISSAQVNDTVFLELRGTDGNSSKRDLALVNVSSNESSPRAFRMGLLETGLGTGIYRGDITVRDRTIVERGWINASYGEVVTVTSLTTPTISATVRIGTLTLYPLTDNGTAKEDAPYDAHYWATGQGTFTWSFDTNASWLSWDAATHNISGVPDNADVGKHWVLVGVANDRGFKDERNFTLTVDNTAPRIGPIAVPDAFEDEPFAVDLNSTDDGQGAVRWVLGSNASGWLSINGSTGLLSGVPTNDDVGTMHLNVTVDDGNGGSDAIELDVRVYNTNDAPLISGTPLVTAIEDEPYTFQFDGTDVDAGDGLTWHLETDARWLAMDTATGLISGVPGNDDVGSYWVNVSVTDTAMASDFRNFTLTVSNVNDPPTIIATLVTEALEGREYRMQFNATDIDVDDKALDWAMQTNGLWLTMHPDGLLNGTPGPEDVGACWVNVTVYDGHGGMDHVNFTVSVGDLVIPPPPPDDDGHPAGTPIPTTTLAICGGGGGLLLLLGAVFYTEPGMYSLFGALMPLYTRLKKEKVLDHFTRGQLQGYIIANPGVHLRDIRDRFELSNGVVAYHLKVLEREGYVTSMNDGIRRRFYPGERLEKKKRHKLTMTQSLLISFMQKHPGMSTTELAKMTGTSHQVVNYHVRKLWTMDLVTLDHEGDIAKCYVKEKEMDKFKDEIASRLREAEKEGTDSGIGGNKEEEGPSADA